jgi:hypothetical protein
VLSRPHIGQSLVENPATDTCYTKKENLDNSCNRIKFGHILLDLSKI